MCFGPSAADKERAAQARRTADEEKRLAIEQKARLKRDAITAALQGRTVSSLQGGQGRRSLFGYTGGGSRGYSSRFDIGVG